jgi:hypothetical protein
MRSPYLELQKGIHNQLFLSEGFYSVELIDKLLSKKGVTSEGNKRTIILIGEYIDSYTIPERWTPLIQRNSFQVLFREPSALKTEDGSYLLNLFHLQKRVPIEHFPEEVTMLGSLRMGAWCSNH